MSDVEDSGRLNRIGPEISLRPTEVSLERERRHAEGLQKLAKLRAARLAEATPVRKRRRHG